MWADYLFYVDADNILTEDDVLKRLMLRNKTIIGPMLETGVAFSNFWSAQNEETGYYERGDDYFSIRNYHTKSIYKVMSYSTVNLFNSLLIKVPMLHSCYLIDMNRHASRKIQFWPRVKEYAQLLPVWPNDDVIYFSGMAKVMGIELWLDNTMAAGWFPYPVQSGVLQNESMKYHFLSKYKIF